MKKIKLTIAAALAAFALVLGSCSSDDGGGPNNNPNPTELRLFAIDTAKVITMESDGSGEEVILNKKVDDNSYLSLLSVRPDGTKIAFLEHQTLGSFPNVTYRKEVRVANANGSGDTAIFTMTEANGGIRYLRYCSDGKVIFVSEVADARTLHTMNADGTGDQTMPFPYDIDDISDDRAFYVWLTGSLGNFTVQILDADGDNGFPGSYHNEDFDTADDVGEASFTADGAFCVIPYREGGTIKARVVDMAAHSSEDFTLVSGVDTSSWVNFRLKVGSDATRAVLTLTGGNFTKSKSYVIDTEAQTVATPFENNDGNIYIVVPN